LGIFETLGNKFKEHFDRKKQEKQQFEQLRRETENQRMITEEQTQRAQAQGLAVKQAQSEIAGKTGIIRMRAVQKAKLLASQQPRDSAVQRFREMTARNKQRTARNREMHAFSKFLLITS